MGKNLLGLLEKMITTFPKQDRQRSVVHQRHGPLLHADGSEMGKQEIEIEIMWGKV